MEQILTIIAQELKKTPIDYLGIFAPSLLSVVAIAISWWNSIGVYKKKRLEANIVWDDLSCTFFFIIRNTGKRTLVIQTVSLVCVDGTNGEELELGMRDNVWSLDTQKGFLKENEMVIFNPVYGSLYDVFAYRGHYFDVDENKQKMPVFLVVTDIDNKKWRYKTLFTLGEIERKLEYAHTYES